MGGETAPGLLVIPGPISAQLSSNRFRSCVTRPRVRFWGERAGSPSFGSSAPHLGLPQKEPTCQCSRCKRRKFDPWVGKIPWRRAWQPTPVFLPGESHGQRSLAGYSPWDYRVRVSWVTKHACMPLPQPGAKDLDGQ